MQLWQPALGQFPQSTLKFGILFIEQTSAGTFPVSLLLPENKRLIAETKEDNISRM